MFTCFFLCKIIIFHLDRDLEKLVKWFSLDRGGNPGCTILHLADKM